MELLSAALWMGTVWAVLGAGFGPAAAFSLAAAGLLATRLRGAQPLPRGALAACAAAGACSFPLWACLVGWSGAALGLPPHAVEAPAGALEVGATLSVGPLFEELLYRERLLSALQSRVGTGPALLASSVAFALPHLEPWSVLAAAWVGPALGALYLGTRNVWACTAAHAGLNAAALLVQSA
jgi:membrane protease YdiL (CAAX protease family)